MANAKIRLPPRAAVLDACVLFPAALRDTLLRAAAAGLYRPYWSELILEEVRRNLISTGRASTAGADRLILAFRRAFPDAIVTGSSTSSHGRPTIRRIATSSRPRHMPART